MTAGPRRSPSWRPTSRSWPEPPEPTRGLVCSGEVLATLMRSSERLQGIVQRELHVIVAKDVDERIAVLHLRQATQTRRLG